MNDNQQIDNHKPEVDQAELKRAEKKFRKAQQTFWERLVGAFTQVEYPAGRVSPHAAGRRLKPKNWRKKRKRRNKIAARSRKINRRRR
jgi:hypothetical protein